MDIREIFEAIEDLRRVVKMKNKAIGCRSVIGTQDLHMNRKQNIG